LVNTTAATATTAVESTATTAANNESVNRCNSCRNLKTACVIEIAASKGVGDISARYSGGFYIWKCWRTKYSEIYAI
jgi:pantoate kinase